MSLLDAKVLQWAKGASLQLGDKAQLFDHCLRGLDRYAALGDSTGVKVRHELGDDIKTELDRVRSDAEQHGEAHFDERETATSGVREGFQFGKQAENGHADDAAADDEDTAGQQEAQELDDEAHEESLRAVRSRAGRRKTVSSEVINQKDVDNFKPPVHDKSEEDEDWLVETLEKGYLFEHLETEDLRTLAKAMHAVEKEKDDALLEAGAEGDTMFVIQSGTAKLDGTTETYEAGAFLGEEELMYSTAGTATVLAEGNLKAWALDRQTYRHIVTKASMKKRALYEDFLSNIDFLEGLTPSERLQVADALKRTEYASGDKIISYGQEGTHFHIIVTGTVKVVGREEDKEDGAEVDVCTFTVGDCIGELEFINKHKTCADVIADGPVKTAKMGRRHFEQVMGPVEEFLKDRYKDHEKFAYYRGKNLEK